MQDAINAPKTLDKPTFVIDGDVYMIVWNHKCGNGGGGDQETTTSHTTVVKSADLAPDIAAVISTPTKWFFYNDETDVIDNNLGSFVNGPDTAPEGSGSAQMSVTGTQRRNIATYQFKDVKLSDIKGLTFSTYSQSSGNGSPASERSAYLNFNVDFDNSDTWQKRLIYLPAANGVVTNDTWQTWDAIDSGNALWSWSGYAANGNKWPDNNTNQYRTWSDIVSSFPNAETRSTDSWFGFRIGEPYSDGFTGNVDKFVIAIKTGLNTHTETYDFEPTPVVIIDVCPNIQGNQSEVPQGYHLEGENCVQDVNNFSGPTGGGGGGGGHPAINNPQDDGEVLGESTSCGLYLNDYLKMGKKNDPEEVKKLQTFLNDYLGLYIPVDGKFGLKTHLAVIKFQIKESLLVLKPWGKFGLKENKGTGYVYKTTLTRINNIMCPDLNLEIPQLP